MARQDSTAIAFDAMSVPAKLLTAGSAACFADFMSFPLDTAKVRLQVQGEVRIPVPLAVSHCVASTGSSLGYPYITVQYRGILGTIATITREEGFRSLYNGLNAGLQRQMCFASVRLGLYEPVKKTYQDALKVTEANRGGALDIWARVLAGMTTGGLAVLFAQPTEVVKIRFQGQARKGLATSTAPVYAGTWDAYRTILTKEGLNGLWRGTLPNVGRNAIVNVSEIVCYDLVKESLIARGLMSDNIACHFTSAVIAGFCATVCASPVDVIKTRYMNSARGKYNGAFDCAVKTLVREGAGAFYKGFWPSFSRLVSWNIVMWISYEQLKRQVVFYYQEEK